MIWYRGVSLTHVCDVKVAQVSVSSPQVRPIDRPYAMGCGAAYAGLRYGVRTVTIRLALPVACGQPRQEAYVQLCGWAAGEEPAPLSLPGWERVHLLAVCTSLPDIDVTLCEQDELALTFTAFDPLWRADFESSAPLQSEVFIQGSAVPEMRLELDNETRRDITWTQDGAAFRLIDVPAGRVAVDLSRQLITLDGQSAMRLMDVTSTFPRPVTGRLNISGEGKVCWRERWL